MQIAKHLSFIAILLLTQTLQAGSKYFTTCNSADCGFGTRISIGGGRFTGAIVGFCNKCNQPVYLHWSPSSGQSEPKPLCTFWDPSVGSIRKVYSCPECKTPFVAIEKLDEFPFCPKCHNKSLQHKHYGESD